MAPALSSHPPTVERIEACFAGIAVGDALGKQTETLSHAEVSRWYPHGVRGFEGTPGTIIPRHTGNSKREWRIGETTDDTERRRTPSVNLDARWLSRSCCGSGDGSSGIRSD